MRWTKKIAENSSRRSSRRDGLIRFHLSPTGYFRPVSGWIRAGLVERGSGKSEVSNYEKVSGRILRWDCAGFSFVAIDLRRLFRLGLGSSPFIQFRSWTSNTKKPALMKTKSTSRSAFFISRLLIGFALYSVGLFLALAGWSKSVVATTAPAQTLGSWTATGSLTTARFSHTETLLPNGKVLVAGGTDSSFFSFASAELYDPATGLWTATGSMATARTLHSATLLPNGKVLVAGGYNNGVNLASAELYDPATGLWTPTGSMAAARYQHTATLLLNGQVLVAGGYNDNVGPLASAELYDPATGLWTPTGSLATARFSPTATLLPNGQVLVAGGGNFNGFLASAELYDPATGLWTATGSMATAREIYTATLLPEGQVLVAGGLGDSGVLTSAELYDPATGLWTPTGSMATARYQHTATLLPNGQVLVAGGYGPIRERGTL